MKVYLATIEYYVKGRYDPFVLIVDIFQTEEDAIKALEEKILRNRTGKILDLLAVTRARPKVTEYELK